MSQHDGVGWGGCGGGALTVNSRRLREIQEDQREKGRHLHHSMRALIHLNHQAAHRLPQAERRDVKPQGIFQSMLSSPGGPLAVSTQTDSGLRLLLGIFHFRVLPGLFGEFKCGQVKSHKTSR